MSFCLNGNIGFTNSYLLKGLPHSSKKFKKWLKRYYNVKSKIPNVQILHCDEASSIFNTTREICYNLITIFNRPGVGGAVLQTAFSFTDRLIHSFSDPYSSNLVVYTTRLLRLKRFQVYHLKGGKKKRGRTKFLLMPILKHFTEINNIF